MLTLLNQVAWSVLQVAFAFVALRITPFPSAPHDQSRAWRVVGLIFLFNGVHALAQDAFAVSAYISGSGSVLWDSYLRWAPALNHGRTLAFTLGFPILLTTRWRVMGCSRTLWRVAVATILGGMVLGALLGISEGPLQASTHFSAVAVLDAAELLTLLLVLFIVLVRSQVDRFLWVSLCVYAFSLAVGTLWISALINLDIPGNWAPSTLLMHAVRAVIGTAMVLAAVWRLSLARRGAPVLGLMEGVGRRKARTVSLP